MRKTLLSTIALATLVAAAPASAQAPSGGSDATVVTDFPHVAVEIVVSDAAGTPTKTFNCDWTEPTDEDMKCIRFSSDPQDIFAAIEENGGVRADKTMVTRGETYTSSFTKRFDGTWLIRSRKNSGGEHFGMVCTADGQTCTRWDAEGAKFAQKEVRAAAAKLKAKQSNAKKGRR